MQSFIIVSYSSKTLFNNNLIVSIKKALFCYHQDLICMLIVPVQSVLRKWIINFKIQFPQNNLILAAWL